MMSAKAMKLVAMVRTVDDQHDFVSDPAEDGGDPAGAVAEAAETAWSWTVSGGGRAAFALARASNCADEFCCSSSPN